jgi:hypothetical protein
MVSRSMVGETFLSWDPIFLIEFLSLKNHLSAKNDKKVLAAIDLETIFKSHPSYFI